MKIRKIISAILTMSVMSACMIPIAKADGLYSENISTAVRPALHQIISTVIRKLKMHYMILVLI